MWDRDGAGPLPPLLVVGGGFTAVGTVPANNIAAYDPSTGSWTALGSGLTSVITSEPRTEISALATLPNGDLVAAGRFTSAGGAPANHIARWDGTTWSPLGSGLSGGATGVYVNALAVLPNGDLVAGGNFTAAGGLPAMGVARWNGVAWSSMVGLNAVINDMIVRANGDLVVAGNTSLGPIARWDGSSWSSLWPSGPTQLVSVLELPNGDILAGSYSGAYRWNGSTWTLIDPGFLGTAYTMLLLPNGNVAFGGFMQLGGYHAFVEWDGLNLTTVPFLNNSVAAGTNVFDLALLPSGELVACGSFQLADGTSASNIVRRSGANWTALVPNGINGPIFAFANMPNGDLIVGGTMTAAGGVSTPRIARWNGTSWSALGSGLAKPSTFLTNPAFVDDLAALPNGDLIAVGGFDTAGGTSASCVARWDGTSWSPLGSGLGGTSPTGNAVAVLPNGDVVVGGFFTTAGGISASRVARWSGTTWSPLGAGVGGSTGAFVSSMAVLPNGNLVVGGTFSVAGSVSVNNIARWNGSTWSPLGTGLTGGVSAMVVLPNGDLVVGGGFASAGGVSAANIARWNGSAWSALGTGLSGGVYGLTALPDGDVIAVGVFGIYAPAGGPGPVRIARWDGAAWTTLGSGLTGAFGPGSTYPYLVPNMAATTTTTGDVVIGGDFHWAGGSISSNLARLRSTCPAAASGFGTGCSGSGGANVLAATALPWIGSTFRAAATGMPALGAVLTVSGLTSTSLPLQSVLPQALPGCTLYASPDVVGVGIPVAGTLTSSVLLPASMSLVGQQFYHQYVPIEWDSMLTISAFTASNALQLTIGVL